MIKVGSVDKQHYMSIAKVDETMVKFTEKRSNAKKKKERLNADSSTSSYSSDESKVPD